MIPHLILFLRSQGYWFKQRSIKGQLVNLLVAKRLPVLNAYMCSLY